jgi:hypothetical protein
MSNPSVRLADLSRIVRLVFDRGDDDLTITFRLLPQGASEPIEVRCRGAADVRFRGERTELKELVLLLAEEISSSGWEGAKYRVKDYEEEVISFVCREIDGPLAR